MGGALARGRIETSRLGRGGGRTASAVSTTLSFSRNPLSRNGSSRPRSPCGESHPKARCRAGWCAAISSWNRCFHRSSAPFAGLAICPEGDKDTYKIDVTTGNSNVEVITSWDSGMPVSVSLLNGSGSSINNGTSNGEKSLRAFAANLPIGTYYAQAYAAATTKNNYKITIKVTQ